MASAAIPALGAMVGLSVFFLTGSQVEPFIETIQHIADKAYLLMGIVPGGADGVTGGIFYSIGGLILAGCGGTAAGIGGVATYNAITNFPSPLERTIAKKLGADWDVSVQLKDHSVHATQNLSKGAKLNVDYDANRNVATGYITREIPSGSTNMFTDGVTYPVPTYETITAEEFSEASLPLEGKNALEIIRAQLPRTGPNSFSTSISNP